jgi:hypothetical protein
VSYDICLYERAFLQRALEQNLDDWTNADPISNEKKHRIRQLLIEKGYMHGGGSGEAEEYFHPNEAWGITVSIYTGEVAIAIPYWEDARIAIEAALVDAEELAEASELTLFDRQR